jgi:dolichol-phosphate mannosyltransferase
MSQRILICIPTYNELDNLPRLLPLIFEMPQAFEVLVIDDGSPDGTGNWVKNAQLTEPRLHLIEREGKQGLGSAYVAGFKWALERGYEFIFEMDADFSHHPQYLPSFLEAMDQGAQVVLGSRYLGGKISVVNWDWQRLLLSYLANLYARMVTRLPIADATGGFKCFRAEALKAIDLNSLQSGGYSFQIETSFRLWKKGFRIAEVPIVFTDRTAGESKLSGKIIREALFVLLRLRLGV